MFRYTEMTLNLIKAFKIIIYNTNTHQKHPNTFPTFPFFQKYISLGLPGRLWTAFELKKLLAYVRNTPDATTLTLHALNLLKRSKTSFFLFRPFPFFPQLNVMGLLFSWP